MQYGLCPVTVPSIHGNRIFCCYNWGHPCPFDIMQKEYGFIGYLLYMSLFGATFLGLLPAIFQPIKKNPSLQMILLKYETSWIIFSMGCMIIFVFITTFRVLTSNLTFFHIEQL